MSDGGRQESQAIPAQNPLVPANPYISEGTCMLLQCLEIIIMDFNPVTTFCHSVHFRMSSASILAAVGIF